MNFTEYLEAFSNPIYEEEGKNPKCGEGLKWDKELQMCVPDPKSKNQENPGDRDKIDVPMFDTHGATGIDGDGYALEESDSVSEMYTQKTEKQRKRDEEITSKFKERDERMKYGKAGKPKEEPLLPGEVKKWDKSKNRWVSNKEGK